MFFFKKRPNADTLEKEEKQKIKLYQEFLETQNSGELKEYFQLHDEINSPTFKVAKEKIVNLSYKNSLPDQKEKEFKKLDRNKNIKRYFETEKSMVLQDFLKFKETENYKDLFDSKKRKQSEKLNTFYLFEKSKGYRNYKELNNSPILKRFLTLKEELQSEEHLSFKAYCNDSKRWEKSDLYIKESRFKALAIQPNISNYLKYKQSNFFEEQKKWELAFIDEFNMGELDKEKWMTSYYWVKDLGRDLYSSPGELQSYIGSKNISVSNNQLTVKTVKESGKGKFWDTKNGFVIKETPYTSAILSCGNSFQQKEGLIKLKFKFSGNTFINHAAWLGTVNNDQSILLYKAQDKKLVVGTLRKKDSKIVKSVQQVNKFPFFKNFHILTVEWDETHIVWKINNEQIKSIKNDLRNAPMHLIINSSVTNEKKSGNGEMHIEWVRSYIKKASSK